MAEQLIYGWTVTADVPGAKERLAIEAARRVLPESEKAVVKVRSKLTKQLFEALRMQPGRRDAWGAQEVPSLTPVASLMVAIAVGRKRNRVQAKRSQY